MRKLGSEKEIETKRKRNTLLLSIFMLGVLVVGTIGFGFMSSLRTSSNGDGKKDTNIRNVGDRWEVIINNQAFYFQNSPDDVKNISVSTYLNLNTYTSKPLYIVSENPAVTNEIFSNLIRYVPRIQEACYGPCNNSDLPEKNCTDNLIIWRDSLYDKVYQEDNCIFIEGDMKVVDAFLYKLLNLN